MGKNGVFEDFWRSAGYAQGRVILHIRPKNVRVVLEGVLYSRAGSVTGFTVIDDDFLLIEYFSTHAWRGIRPN